MIEPTWSEDASNTFIDYGRFFVPDREHQQQLICDLIPPSSSPFTILELSHGEGLLAEALLSRFPQATVIGYDISPEMRQAAARRLARFGARFQTHHFDLRDTAWRQPDFTPQAIVSSLTIHHLDGPQKERLYFDMHGLLAPGGAFLIADLIEPANDLGRAAAAAAWDTAVKEREQLLAPEQAVFAEFKRLEWNLFRHPDPEIDKPSPLFAQLRWLDWAGFTAVDVFWLLAGHAIFGGYKR